jgi:hypothetical protein
MNVSSIKPISTFSAPGLAACLKQKNRPASGPVYPTSAVLRRRNHQRRQ